MNYIVKGHNFISDVQPMIQVFYPNEEYKILTSIGEGTCILSEHSENQCTAALYINGECVSTRIEPVYPASIQTTESVEIRRAVKASIYFLLSEYTGIKNPWGTLTGIRPAKIVREMLERGLSREEITTHLKDFFFLSEEKVKLLFAVAENEKAILSGNNDNKVSLYIGIPFCPTRCVYCSFASYPYKKYEKSVPDYLACLFKELDLLSVYCKDRILDTVYIGGGTPTSLDESCFDSLLCKVKQNFDFSAVREFTVEAGRPDTITDGKLETMKHYGVSRISINPQSMNGKSLVRIGRNHTPEQFLSAYESAAAYGFDNINIDLILGLPGETLSDVEYTFSEIAKLNPASVTVHTLAVKRASRLMEHMRNNEYDDYRSAMPGEIQKMLEFSANACARMGLSPYYMYRQKNMLGNFENVGYAKAGGEGIYNVLIMEETQSILAAGAAGVSKLVNTETGTINRIFNVKNVEEYIKRIDEMLERKTAGLPAMQIF